MGLTVVKENFFLVACSSSAFAISHSLVLSFMNTLNLIQAPSIQLSSRQTYWNICLHLKRSLQHMHKLRQKLKLPLTVLRPLASLAPPFLPVPSSRAAHLSEHYIPKPNHS